MNDAALIVQIGDLIQTKNDKSKQLQSSDYQSNGVLPIVDQGSKPICGYTNDLSKRYDKGLPVVIFGDHTLHTKFIDFHFAIGADGTQVLTPKSEDCDTKYLYYLISRATELIGSEGYKRHFKILKEFDIEYIKPLSEQKKIAAILSSVDEVIEKTRAQIDKLKDLKTGMMQELLTKGIGPGGVPHTEFKDSPVGRIPASWNVLAISAVCSEIVDCVNKTAPVVDYVTPYRMIRTTNVRDGRIKTEGLRYVTPETFNLWTRRLKLEAGDLIFTREAPVGECGLLKDATGLFLGQRTMVYRANKNKMSNVFLLYSMQSEYCQAQLSDLSGGSTTPHLRVPDCSKILLKVPPISEQTLISESIRSVDSLLEMRQDKVAELSKLKKALMQDLLTGKVRVNVDARELADA